MDRLTNSIDYCQLHCDFGKSNECFFQDKSKCYEKNIYEKLREYEDLEEQGLLLRLPCKVGDTIYILDRDGQPRRMIVDKPDIRCHCSKEDNLCMVLCDRKNTGVCAYRFCNDGSDIGKTVFLTQAEAEQKLKEMESD